jgi:hypothetical protein
MAMMVLCEHWDHTRPMRHQESSPARLRGRTLEKMRQVSLSCPLLHLEA